MSANLSKDRSNPPSVSEPNPFRINTYEKEGEGTEESLRQLRLFRRSGLSAPTQATCCQLGFSP